MGGISPTNAFDKGKIVIPVVVERHGIEEFRLYELHVVSGDRLMFQKKPFVIL